MSQGGCNSSGGGKGISLPIAGCQTTNNVNCELMAEKNDQDFIAFCDELRTYLSENYHFLNKYIRLLNKIKFVRRRCRRIGEDSFPLFVQL